MKYRLTISDAISLALLAAVGALFLFLYSIDGDIMKWMRERRAAERIELMRKHHVSASPDPWAWEEGINDSFKEGWFLYLPCTADRAESGQADCEPIPLHYEMRRERAAPKLADRQWQGPGLLPGDQGAFPSLPEAVPPLPPPPAK